MAQSFMKSPEALAEPEIYNYGNLMRGIDHSIAGILDAPGQRVKKGFQGRKDPIEVVKGAGSSHAAVRHRARVQQYIRKEELLQKLADRRVATEDVHTPM
jgi:hypothetical protein